MVAGQLFTANHLEVLGSARRVARDLAGQHYALGGDWFRATSHRVCTVRELRGGEVLGNGQLAHIRRVLRLDEGPQQSVLRARRVRPHYRICLQDHNLLGRARREPRLDLELLLIGVLTHEYVHLVRFAHHEHPYDCEDTRRPEEELRVGAITRRILQRQGHGRLRAVSLLLEPEVPIEAQPYS